MVDEAQVYGVVAIVRITAVVVLAAVAPSEQRHGVVAMAAGLQAHGVGEVAAAVVDGVAIVAVQAHGRSRSSRR